MTTATIFSNLSMGQNAQGGINGAAMPNTVVNTGTSITRASATLTVVPSTGWAEASIMGGFDGVNWIGAQEIYVAPNGTGTRTENKTFRPHPYITAVLMNVAPGCAASLTVTY